ncbi:MAG: NAD(P)-binding domain-containing protein, partial [Pseudomonas aeruginosa]|nr:NAD(P)-binding domain-containing protein [Pseudomonas aeruginosa]
MTDIAFLGLGNMGGPMAANLLKAGHRVNVFDLQPKAVLSLVEQGAQGADSALQCCEGAEVVISMLPAGQHVAEQAVQQRQAAAVALPADMAEAGVHATLVAHLQVTLALFLDQPPGQFRPGRVGRVALDIAARLGPDAVGADEQRYRIAHLELQGE